MAGPVRAQFNSEYAYADGPDMTQKVTTAMQPPKVSVGSGILIRLAALAIIAVFAIIGLQAYTAALQYENNQLTEQNEYIQAEIDSLSSQLVDKTNITNIEEIATEEYEMVYPTADNCIIIGDIDETEESLASAIIDEAYN